MRDIFSLKWLRRAWWVSLLLFSLVTVQAQTIDYRNIYWFFGQSDLGITFNKSDFAANLDSIQNPVFGRSGGAVATDPLSGDILFYSDGNLVYDRSHQLISGWVAGLNGNLNGNQAAAVSPTLNGNNQFIVIANSAGFNNPGSINTALVDMNQQGNSPDPQASYGRMSSPVASGLSGVSEGMVVIGNFNGSQHWLVTHDQNSTTFRVTPIGTSGLNLAGSVAYDFAADGMPALSAANLSYSLILGKIAVSPQDTSRNVHILNFSRTSGTLSYDSPILNSATRDVDGDPADTYSIYDTQWSPDGSKLYISRHGDAGTNGMLYQYDMANPGITLAPMLPAAVHRSYGLQLGPDSLLYHLYQESAGGPLLAGLILDSDSTSTLARYIPAIFNVSDFNGKQFPAVLPYMRPNYAGFEFVIDGGCYGNPVKFLPKIIPQANTYTWDFGDGSFSNYIAPNHEYTSPGVYNVTLTTRLNGLDSVFVRQVTIIPSDTVVLRNDLGSELPEDTTICIDETLLLDATTQNTLSYIWSVQGHSEPTYTVDTAGYYWVVAEVQTNSGICQSYDAINVNEYGFQLQVQNQWYFGDMAGVDFNQQPPVALTDGAMIAPEGCTAVSDRNGNILFYSDGETVFGRTGEFLGEFIGGDQTATQSVLAVPFPQDETNYYIFTTREVFNGDGEYILSYSILDIKKNTNGDPGSINNQLKNIPLYLKNTERITALGGYGNNAILVAHEYGNNTFRLYPITTEGIGEPILSSIGSVHDFGSEESAEGYMRFSPDASKLAVSLSKNGNNYIDLFDYTDSTTTISNHVLIEFENESYPEYQVYGLEFSPGSRKLYASLSGSVSRIYEVWLDSLDANQQPIKVMIREENARIGALQRGPTGQIYVAIDGANNLPFISPNEIYGQPSVFNPTGIDLAGRTSRLGLPNFVQNVSSAIGGTGIGVTGLCVGQPTFLSGNRTDNIDMNEWIITRTGDSTRLFTDTQLATEYTFQQAGDYTVTFHLYNRCGLDTTIVQDITVLDPPEDPTIPDAFSICTGAEMLDADSTATTGLTYLWNTGSTDRMIPVNEPGIYSVIISYVNNSSNACTSTKATFVADGRPQFELGPDLTVCRDDAVNDLRTGLTPNSYDFTWRINGAQQADTTNSISVDASTPGIFQYSVNVRDNLTTCASEDTVTITINELPTATFTITNSTCNNSTGEVIINSQSNNSLANLFDAGNITIPFDNLAAGSYNLVVQDQITGCSEIYTINVIDTDANFNISTNSIPDCGDGSLEVGLVSAVYPINYLLSNLNTGDTYSGSESIQSDPAFTVNNMVTGTYILQVDLGNGCTNFEDSILIESLPSAGLNLLPEYVNCQTRIDIDPDPTNQFPGQTYAWIDPDGIEITAPILSTSTAGSYTVTASAPGICDTTTTFNIILQEIPIVNIGITGDGCGTPIQLTANIDNPTPGTNYSYLWTNGTVGQFNILPPPASGDFINYQNISVTLTNQQTGCTGSDGPVNVTTYQDYTVFLSSSIACDDGGDITISANILNISSDNIESYSWDGPQVGIGRFDERVITIDTEGTYTVTTDWNGCKETAATTIVRSPVTPSNIDPVYQFCPEPPANEIVVVRPGTFISYALFNITTGQQILEFEPGTYEIYSGGLHEGSGLNSFGCVTTDTFDVLEVCIPEVYAPNAFSPEATIEKNRTFSIDGKFINNFQIIIYNKWGEVVFESKDKNFEWDGTKNGQLLPNGTYAYVMRFTGLTDADPTEYERRGGVTLLR